MEKEIQLGSVGDLDLKLDKGKARVEIKAAVADGAVSGGAFVEVGADVLVDKLKAAVEAKSPAALQPAEEGAFALLKSLLLGL
jgi:hypothetical protein